MLLRDANPGAYALAMSRARGPGQPPGYQQPMVLQALIDRADDRRFVSVELVNEIPGATALPVHHVKNALHRLIKSGWVDGYGDGRVKLTGVLEQP